MSIVLHLWTNLLGSLQRSPGLPNWFYGGKEGTEDRGDKENVENIKGKSRNSRIRIGKKEKGMGGGKERKGDRPQKVDAYGSQWHN